MISFTFLLSTLVASLEDAGLIARRTFYGNRLIFPLLPVCRPLVIFWSRKLLYIFVGPQALYYTQYTMITVAHIYIADIYQCMNQSCTNVCTYYQVNPATTPFFTRIYMSLSLDTG
jgi:hypothetical protein